MDSTSSKEFLSKHLKDEQLSAVVFIRDYLQLQFDGPSLDGYVWPMVKTSEYAFQYGDPGYRDALCHLIGKRVIAATATPGKSLRIEFEGGSLLEFSLKQVDRAGPEAVMFQSADQTVWDVW